MRWPGGGGSIPGILAAACHAAASAPGAAARFSPPAMGTLVNTTTWGWVLRSLAKNSLQEGMEGREGMDGWGWWGCFDGGGDGHAGEDHHVRVGSAQLGETPPFSEAQGWGCVSWVGLVSR